MAEDLKLSGMRYQLAAAAFFLLEIPWLVVLSVPFPSVNLVPYSNVVLQRLRPSIWVSPIALAWGIVMVSMAFVKTWQGLIMWTSPQSRSTISIPWLICIQSPIIPRVAESGLLPALCQSFTHFFLLNNVEKQKHFVSLCGIAVTSRFVFVSVEPMAIYVFVTLGAFGGLLAFCIEKMDGSEDYTAGRGFFYWRVCYPSTATFLTPTERERLLDILQRDTVGEPSHFEMKFVSETLGNPKSWLQALTFLGLFLPVLGGVRAAVRALYYMSRQTLTNYQSLTIPPYAAGCVATILLGALSDRVRMRGPFFAGLSLFGIAGFTMLLATDAVTQPAAGYAGCVIVAVGVYPCIPLVQAWSAGNAGGSLKKAVIFGADRNGWKLWRDMRVVRVPHPRHSTFPTRPRCRDWIFMLAFLGSSFATLLCRRVNQTRERLGVKENIELDRKAECSALGTDSPVFRNLHFESNPGNICTGGKLLEGSGVLLFKPKPKGIKKSTLAILCTSPSGHIRPGGPEEVVSKRYRSLRVNRADSVLWTSRRGPGRNRRLVKAK
ncbi:hypothetical protein B0H13DRAFT_1861710 [Mycena leptocephala]|nr:hypothetical protein B0H13DRAFT_1861710 [Mycena leptocephala]